MKAVKDNFLLVVVLLGIGVLLALSVWPDSLRQLIILILLPTCLFLLIYLAASVSTMKQPEEEQPLTSTKFKFLKVFSKWFLTSLVLGSILTLIWWPETYRDIIFYLIFATGWWLMMFFPMLKEVKEQPEEEQPLTSSKFKTMKVYLRWFIASIVMGGVLTAFWAPEDFREGCYFMLFGTGFWCAMLLPMLNAEE